LTSKESRAYIKANLIVGDDGIMRDCMTKDHGIETARLLKSLECNASDHDKKMGVISLRMHHERPSVPFRILRDNGYPWLKPHPDRPDGWRWAIMQRGDIVEAVDGDYGIARILLDDHVATFEWKHFSNASKEDRHYVKDHKKDEATGHRYRVLHRRKVVTSCSMREEALAECLQRDALLAPAAVFLS
jgi:hypothetical protein